MLTALVGCGEGAVAAGMDTEGGSSGSDGFASSAATTGFGSTRGADSSGSTGTNLETGSTGQPGGVCPVLCGDPAQCCDGNRDCVAGTCIDACDSGVRCGAGLELCCASEELCIAGTCVAPTVTCLDAFDCQSGQWCEPSMQVCLGPDASVCRYVPSTDTLELALDWSVQSDEFASSPVVGDVDGDGLPEVVLNSWRATDPDGFTVNHAGEVIVLDGTDGTEQFRVQHDPDAGSFGSNARSSLGLADVDGDEVPDIIYTGRPQIGIAPFANNSSLIHAINGMGQPLWASTAADGSPYYLYVRQGGPVAANLDADEQAEVVFGTAVLDDAGTVVFDQDRGDGRGGGVYGSNGSYLGGLATFADLSGDGAPELVSGRHAWTVDWTGPTSAALNLHWEHVGADGYPAVADLDGDGEPEVVLVGQPEPFTTAGLVHVLDGETGVLWCGVDVDGSDCAADPSLRTQPIAIPGGGRGGPPAIADFDGDGRLEIAVAGANTVAVYDLNRPGEVIVQPVGAPPPAAGELFVRWSAPIEDPGTGGPALTAFDFHGDGVAELLINDECYFRAYSGDDGATLVEIENPAVTIREAPLVVDIDGDRRSELVLVAADSLAADRCGAIPGYTPRRGIFVYEAAAEPWAPTRRTWNTHGYTVTGATPAGNVPPTYAPHWTEERTNAFRKAADEILAVPDAAVEISVDRSSCDAGELLVRATVRNLGSVVMAAGATVTLYEGTPARGMWIGSQATPDPIAPGHQHTLEWSVSSGAEATAYSAVVDEDNLIHECDEANSAASIDGVACP